MRACVARLLGSGGSDGFCAGQLAAFDRPLCAPDPSASPSSRLSFVIIAPQICLVNHFSENVASKRLHSFISAAASLKKPPKPKRRPYGRPPFWKGRRREQRAVFPASLDRRASLARRYALTQTGEAEPSPMQSPTKWVCIGKGKTTPSVDRSLNQIGGPP